MRFLVDENLPPSITEALVNHGHDAIGITRGPHQGSTDEEVWRLAAVEQRILITQDLDFPLDALPRPSGLVLLRLPSWFGATRITTAFEDFIRDQDLAELTGCITVVSPGRSRSRAW
ncbi:MAG: hypothetical protein GEU75_04975 [Dehalococcoidia bacterium]|nr:hypothetical protein [Dehalococcoidia bacterium]